MVYGADNLFFGVGIDEIQTNTDALRELYLIIQQLQAAGFNKDDAIKFMAELVAAQTK